MGGGTGTAITDQINPNHLPIAMEFLEYAKLTYEANVKIWTEFGFDPFRHDVFSDPRLREPLPYFSNEIVFDVILDIYDEDRASIFKPDLPRDQLGHPRTRGLLPGDGGKHPRSGDGAEKAAQRARGVAGVDVLVIKGVGSPGRKGAGDPAFDIG